ncbi:MAG: NDP-sugar synthase [Deltaproteobacteria bacterium]|nr:NDP-sugar synthase [Deltaproteobacteria bacterium]
MGDVRRAFVLAAGFGTRLRPLAEELPKPAWPFFDVPLAAHVLRLLHRSGVGEGVVNLHHLPDLLQDALTPWVPEGLRVHWSREAEILGTGGALAGWRAFLAQGSFLLANGDTYQEIDLDAMERFHRERGGLATLALRRLPAGDAGPIETDAEGRIVRFLSSRLPGAGTGTPCEFTGIHCLEPEILEHLPPGPHCINAQVHAKLVARGERLFGFPVPDRAFWSDLGTPERYLGSHRDLLASGRVPPGRPGTVILGRERTAEGGDVVGPSYLGRGARVEEGAVAGPFAVVGSGAVVACGTRLEESVLWPGATTKRGDVLGRTILSASGRSLRVGPGG